MADQNAPMSPMIGNMVRLVSVSDIRYEGVLFSINLEQSQLCLQNVRCFGHQDENLDQQKPPSSFYEFIVFRGHDIKALDVIYDQPPPQQQFNDPAILSAEPRAAKPAPSPYVNSGAANPWGPPGAPPQQYPGQQSWNQQSPAGQEARTGADGLPTELLDSPQGPSHAPKGPHHHTPGHQAPYHQQTPPPVAGKPAPAPAPTVAITPMPPARPPPPPAGPRGTPLGTPPNAPGLGPGQPRPLDPGPPGFQNYGPPGGRGPRPMNEASPGMQHGPRGGPGRGPPGPPNARPIATRPPANAVDGLSAAQAAARQALQPPAGGVRPLPPPPPHVARPLGPHGGGGRGRGPPGAGRGAPGRGWGPGRGPFTPEGPAFPPPTPMPAEDFDFESELQKFSKFKLTQEEVAENPEVPDAVKVGTTTKVYDKDDFFDSLSCDALSGPAAVPDNGQGGRSARFAEMRRLNMETFGGVGRVGRRAPSGAYRGGYRGGGRGGRGQGYQGRGRGQGAEPAVPA